jgi:hypothetical protein
MGMRGDQPVSCARRRGSPSSSGISFGRRPGRVGPDLDGRLRLAHERLEQVADAEGFTPANVIGAAGLPFLHQQPVGAHGVADVGDVAPRVEVANLEHRLPNAGFRFDYLPREAGRGVGRRLPRARVVERPRDDHAAARRESDELLRELADAVRTGRANRGILRQRGVRGPIDERRSGDEHRCVELETLERGEQVVRARTLTRARSPSPTRCCARPRSPRSGTPPTGASPPAPPRRLGVGDVDGSPGHAFGRPQARRNPSVAPGGNRRLVLEQVFDEMAAGESGRTCHEREPARRGHQRLC